MALAQYIPVHIDDLPESDAFPFVLYTTMNGRFFPMVDGNQAIDDEIRQKLRQNEHQWAFLGEEDFPHFLRLLYGSDFQDKHIPRLRYLHDHYFPVEGQALQEGSTLPCYLFTLNENLLPSLLVAPELRTVDNEITKDHVETYPLWIHRRDILTYQSYLQQVWAVDAKEAPLNFEGGILLRMEVCLVTHGLFQNQEVARHIETAKKVVGRLRSVMQENPKSFYSLLKVSDLWFNAFIHSVNVAVLSMGVGLEWKLGDEDLEILGLGGLLHDIGNTRLDPNLLLSAVRMNHEARKQFHDHVRFGVEFCDGCDLIPEEVTRVVAQHHERYDGTGYPHALPGNQLDPLGQIVGLMEVYDAMTNRQPFRKAYTPFQAYSKIINMGGAIQQNLLRSAIICTGKQERWIRAMAREGPRG